MFFTFTGVHGNSRAVTVTFLLSSLGAAACPYGQKFHIIIPGGHWYEVSEDVYDDFVKRTL